MKDKLISTDHDFVEAYKNVTELLQSFLNRQQSIKKDPDVLFDERGENSKIIHYIQWVRYHFWGNSDSTIEHKTNITKRAFQNKTAWFTTMLPLNEFARKELNTTKEFVTSTELIELILDKILPKQSHSNSIFATDLIERSISLQNEVNRMKQKIHCDD